ncbi:hypothetical protein [Candidatus Palauibacter sp.]|uniref:hypothetical protein n=1 Tax=Candidatus Palauibacter sp. TaxID=3101350 RepID=UPI003B525118
MANDAKRVLVEFADGSPFGPVAVRRLLGCRAKRAARAIESLVGAGLARPTDRGSATLYRLSPRGRDLASAVLELRSGSKGDRKALDTDGMDHGRRR